MTSIIQIVGHSQDEKKANHERIVEIAAARMRESGTEAPGVAEIMRAAGLTHGGFYKHFDSRDQLVAEAAERAFAASARRPADALEGAEDPLAAFADFSLSAAHRDDAVVALSSMVGALLIARAVEDPELSDELLAGVRERVVTAR